MTAPSIRRLLADADQTLAFGASLSTVCVPGTVIWLLGDLGAGKTTLVRGLLRALGHEGAIRSPTYTLVEPYETMDFVCYHFDLYRLEDPEELDYIGARDYFDGRSVCLIEWPEKARETLGRPDLVLRLAHDGAGRSLRIQADSGVGERAIEKLNARLVSP